MVLEYKLTDKQRKFADEYIKNGNAMQSAIKAGYSTTYAKSLSHKILENIGVKNYINDRLKELDSEKIATQEEVLKYLTSVMRGECDEETLIGRGSGYQEITKIAVSAKDRLKAADLLNKVYQVAEPDSTTSDSIVINFNGVGRDEP